MYKILIADDEQVEINILNTIINAAFPSNVEVQRASNGKMAKSMFSAVVLLRFMSMAGNCLTILNWTDYRQRI